MHASRSVTVLVNGRRSPTVVGYIRSIVFTADEGGVPFLSLGAPKLDAPRFLRSIRPPSTTTMTSNQANTPRFDRIRPGKSPRIG